MWDPLGESLQQGREKCGRRIIRTEKGTRFLWPYCPSRREAKNMAPAGIFVHFLG
jgi:hypothetical protein